MSNITVRVPTDLMERVNEIAARDYIERSAALRRLIRLGIAADERHERVDEPREPARAAS